MSHIPNSAMPHAAPSQDSQNSQDQQTGGGFSLSESAGRVAELVRENPKTAAAAGAAVVAGIAAAAIPLARGRGKSEKGSTSGRSKTTATKGTGTKSTKSS